MPFPPQESKHLSLFLDSDDYATCNFFSLEQGPQVHIMHSITSILGTIQSMKQTIKLLDKVGPEQPGISL